MCRAAPRSRRGAAPRAQAARADQPRAQVVRGLIEYWRRDPGLPLVLLVVTRSPSGGPAALLERWELRYAAARGGGGGGGGEAEALASVRALWRRLVVLLRTVSCAARTRRRASFGRAAVARGALARPDPRAPRSYSIAASLPCARLARRAEVDARRARGGAGTAALGFAVATREVGGGGWLVLDGSRLRVESKYRCEHICVVLARSVGSVEASTREVRPSECQSKRRRFDRARELQAGREPRIPPPPPNHRWNPTQVRRAGLRLGAAAALRGRRRGAGAGARGVLLRRAVGDRPLRARARGVRAAAAAAARPHIGPRRHSAARPPVGALASPRARAAQRRRRRRQRHGPQRRAPRGSRRVVEQPRRARAARAPRARPAPRRAARAAVL